MPKFKDKVIRKDEGGFFEGVVRPEDSYLRKAIDSVLEGTGRAAGRYSTDFSRGLIELMGGNPDLPQARKTEQEQLNKNQLESSGKRSMDLTRQIIPSNLNLNPTAIAMAPAPKAVNTSVAKSVNTKKPVAPVANVSPAGISKRETDLESEMYQQGMGIAPANLTNAMSAYGKPTTPTIPDIGNSIKERIKSSVAAPDMAKAAGELPKTKSGMKKFMDEYGKFIALGALAGAGGKKGAIAAPIMAALPGILKMLQNRGKKTPGAPAGTPVPGASIPVAHGGLLSNKSAAHPKKKMAGGAIRKFKGGSMNTMKDNLVPKYKHGGDMPKGMPKEMMAMMGKKYKHGGEMSKGMSQGMMDMMGKKGKATGDMPEHKKMDMGMPIGKMPDSKKMGMAKPKPSSMNQKFAKGGTAKYASGGMCKGYGIAKKIRSTGVMN